LFPKDDDEVIILYQASYSGNVQILERIWKWAKEQLSPEELNNLLLAQNKRKKIAWHVKVRWVKVEILDKLWEWAKEVLNTFNNTFLLDRMMM
jgi:hypothetical protein